jgi:hypothetical protein
MPRTDKLAAFTSGEIDTLLSGFLNVDGQMKRHDQTHRYASFDHCYVYFRQFASESTRGRFLEPENIELACLQLGFYLASWGMYRGSTDLLQRSGMALVPILEYLATADINLWNLDVPEYTQDSIEMLMAFYCNFYKILDQLKISPTATLRTKILLGTMGNIPAFDNYFARATGAWKPTPKFLSRLREFHHVHKDTLEKRVVRCRAFAAKESSMHHYPMAKMLDMIFFQKALGPSAR